VRLDKGDKDKGSPGLGKALSEGIEKMLKLIVILLGVFGIFALTQQGSNDRNPKYRVPKPPPSNTDQYGRKGLFHGDNEPGAPTYPDRPPKEKGKAGSTPGYNQERSNRLNYMTLKYHR
jgi:hypothetical protein